MLIFHDMAWTKRSVKAMNEWLDKTKLNIEEPEIEPAADRQHANYRNFKVVAEPGVLDEEKGEISIGGYDYFDSEQMEEVSFMATGSPDRMSDGSDAKWINYDLLYIKQIGTDKDNEGNSEHTGLTHNLFPPQLKEGGGGIFNPEDYCTSNPILAKPLEIVFLMNDLPSSDEERRKAGGYCEGSIYVKVQGENEEDEPETDSSSPGIVIAEHSVDDIRKETRKYYDDPKRKWALTGKCAIRLYSDVMTSEAGTLPADFQEALILPIGVYPVRLGYSDNGSDRAWLPEIDTGKSSLPISNLFVKGWTGQKSLIKTRSLETESGALEDGFTRARIRPFYEIPAYKIFSEKITVPVVVNLQNGRTRTRDTTEYIRWVEQIGFIRSRHKDKLESILSRYKSNPIFQSMLPSEMTGDDYEIPYWTHENGAIVCSYGYNSARNEFWHKLSSLLAAKGGIGELTVIQKREPSKELANARMRQAAKDASSSPSSATSQTLSPGGVMGEGIGVKPEDSEPPLGSFVRIEQYGTDVPKAASILPGSPGELPDYVKNEIALAVIEFNSRISDLAKNVNFEAMELEHDLSDSDVIDNDEWAGDYEIWHDFTDGGRPYLVMAMGGREWFIENYRRRKPREGSPGGAAGCNIHLYDHTVHASSEIPDYVSTYGYMYNHSEAAELADDIAADGWRVPDVKDWDDLLRSVNTLPEFNNSTGNDSAMWLRGASEWLDAGESYGSEGFNALPGGSMGWYSDAGWGGFPEGLNGINVRSRACFIAASIENPETGEKTDPFYAMMDKPLNMYYHEVGYACDGDKGSFFNLRFVRDLASKGRQTPVSSNSEPPLTAPASLAQAALSYSSVNGWARIAPPDSAPATGSMPFAFAADAVPWSSLPLITSDSDRQTANLNSLRWTPFENGPMDAENENAVCSEAADWIQANWTGKNPSVVYFLTAKSGDGNYAAFFRYDMAGSQWMASWNKAV